MEVSVNEKKKKISNNVSLAEAIAELKITETTGIAIAINDKVIKRDNWTTEKLKSNDEILIIRAAQGG